MRMICIYILYNGGVYLCISVCNEKVTTSWIVGDVYMLPKLHRVLALANPRWHLAGTCL